MDARDAGAELVRRAQAGEPEALNELLERASPAVRRALQRLVGARLARQVSLSDLEQEVLLQGVQAVRRLPAGAGPEDLLALLLQHARWSVGRAAERRVGPERESLGAVEAAPRPASSLGAITRADELSWFRRRIVALETPLRDVVLGRLEGRTFREIGAELGIGEEAARKRYLRAALSLKTGPGPAG
ncbi:MAG: sigma-70 family RNA polymerase sigma factor [Planctomycetota bacterium]